MKQKKSIIIERRHKILSLFSEHEDLHVSDLSRMLGVSELTIRRDLDALAGEGLIQRVHGGGRTMTDSYPVAPVFSDKHRIGQQQKHDIAVYISSLVNDGDTVFLNAGTTTMQVINEIKDKHIVIVTNNALACTVMDHCAASLISTGGEYNQHNQSYTGLMAASILQKMNASLCVLGVNGISADNGITTSNYMETMINEEMLKRCRGKRIAAADSSKIGKVFNFSTAHISNIDILVTDSGADSRELQKIRDAGVKVILADVLSPEPPQVGSLSPYRDLS